MIKAVHRITDEAQLREIIGGGPATQVVAKLSDHINELTRQFIEASPFVCVGTALAEGGLDVTPRGDPPGFIRVLDERTVLLPDRPGNRIADTGDEKQQRDAWIGEEVGQGVGDAVA